MMDDVTSRLVAIGKSRGRVHAFAGDIGGHRREIVILARGNPKRGETDPLERALAQHFKAQATADFDRRGISGVRIFNSLSRLFNYCRSSFAPAPEDPAAMAEDRYVKEQATIPPSNPADPIDLTTGHRRTLPEVAQLAVVTFFAIFRGAFYATGAGMAAKVISAETGKALLISLYATTQVLKFYIAGEYALAYKFRETNWYKRVFPAMSLAISRRVDTAAGNLINNVESNSARTQILVVVDPIYTRLLASRLEAQGFKGAS